METQINESSEPKRFRIERVVDFSDTDMARIVHFSAFFRYMEAAEAAFFAELGETLIGDDERGGFGYPRVDAQCSYRRPLRFPGRVWVDLTVERLRASSIHYAFLFIEPDTEEVLAEGSLVVTRVRADAQGQLRAEPLPEELRTKVNAFLTALKK